MDYYVCFMPVRSLLRFHFVFRTSTLHSGSYTHTSASAPRIVSSSFIHFAILRNLPFHSRNAPFAAFIPFTAHNSPTLSSGIYLPPETYSPRKENQERNKCTTEFPHHPSVVPETQHKLIILSLCFWSVYSLSAAFRCGFSSLKTSSPFRFHSIHSPQHRTRSGKSSTFRKLHFLRFTPALILPFQWYIPFPAAYSPQKISVFLF